MLELLRLMMTDIEFLENERKLLWEEVNKIKKEDLPFLRESLKQLSSSIPQDVSDLKSYKSSIEKLKSAFRQYREQYEDITKKCAEALTKSTTIDDIYKDVQEIQTDLNKINQDIIQKAETIKKAIDNNLDLPASIENTINSIDTWNANYKQATKQAQEIKQAYIEVFGGKITDEKGNTQVVSGFVDELNDAYNDLQIQLKSLETSTKENYHDSIQKWNVEYAELKDKIEKLLPGAMSAGLAYAFIDKGEQEQKERKNSATTFYIAIGVLIVVSMLPVFINLSLLRQTAENSIEEAVKILLNLTWAMLPIYIPILWVAIFANKSMNLSKKLIEEYSHKEAMAKTYEGLASQIQKLPDDALSRELGNKLIENTLNASADNPSRHITNYNTCDNPVMELLNNKNLYKIVNSGNFETFFNKVKQIITLFPRKQSSISDQNTDEKE
jgi:hypothetical protein